mgnify:CR=1 FL=1
MKLQAQRGRPVKVAWFPGPQNAGWVMAGDAGFREAIQGGQIEIVDQSVPAAEIHHDRRGLGELGAGRVVDEQGLGQERIGRLAWIDG